jgi:uncharacterized protein YydD (DUF2326 family)
LNAYDLADRIETSPYAEYKSAKEAVTTLRQQADRIAELEYELDKTQDHLNELLVARDLASIRSTPQTKPLSDEEIADCADEAKVPYDDNKGFYVMHSNGSWVNIGGYLDDFARVIEAKVRGDK